MQGAEQEDLSRTPTPRFISLSQPGAESRSESIAPAPAVPGVFIPASDSFSDSPVDAPAAVVVSAVVSAAASDEEKVSPRSNSQTVRHHLTAALSIHQSNYADIFTFLLLTSTVSVSIGTTTSATCRCVATTVHFSAATDFVASALSVPTAATTTTATTTTPASVRQPAALEVEFGVCAQQFRRVAQCQSHSGAQSDRSGGLATSHAAVQHECLIDVLIRPSVSCQLALMLFVFLETLFFCRIFPFLSALSPCATMRKRALLFNLRVRCIL